MASNVRFFFHPGMHSYDDEVDDASLVGCRLSEGMFLEGCWKGMSPTQFVVSIYAIPNYRPHI